MSKNVSISSLLGTDHGYYGDGKDQGSQNDNEVIIIPDGEESGPLSQSDQDQSQNQSQDQSQQQPPLESHSQAQTPLLEQQSTQPVELSPTPNPEDSSVPLDDIEVVPDEDKLEAAKTTKRGQTKKAPAKPRAKTATRRTAQTKTTQAKSKAQPKAAQTKATAAKQTKTKAKAKADSNNNEDETEPTEVPAGNNDLRDMVSRFQTNITVGNSNVPILIDDGPVPDLEPSPLPHSPTKVSEGTTNVPIEKTPQPIMIGPSSASASPSISNLMASEKLQQTLDQQELNSSIVDHIKRFQTNFVASPSKTSISSIINVDEPEMLPIPERTIPNPESSVVPEDKTTVPENKTAEKSTTKKPAPKKRKLEKKPGTTGNKRKKTPEVISKPEKEVINLPPPELIDVSNEGKSTIQEEKEENIGPIDPEKEKEKEKEKERERSREKERERERERERELERIELEKKEKKELPIIALNVPLIDSSNPKAGQSEVVVNVLKLAEDKYGWSTIHPEAKSAIEVMDDLIEDNDGEDNKDEENKEEEDEEEEELEDRDGGSTNANGGTNSGGNKKKKDENLTEEQLMRQHQTKMNRKVGKYDYEDPFIDDDELQWEEKISSTKEGFFVYWGPLIEERNNNTSKKSTKKR